MNGSDAQSSLQQLVPGSLGLVALFAILGLIGLQLPRLSEPGKTATGTQQKGLALQRPSVDVPPLQLVRDYLNLPDERKTESQPDDPNDFQECLAKQLEDVFEQRRPEMRFLIATVPDPIDSHFQLLCDGAISAIARGFEAHGFVLDRYHFPWSDELQMRAANTTTQNGGSKVQQPLFRRQPGAILFRRQLDGKPQDADVNQLVMVLLVGETPTAGIHKPALAAALDFVAAWRTANWEQLTTIRVLGPEFSGSSASLRHQLIEWWKLQQFRFEEIHIDILSGSATADKNKEILDYELAGVRLTFQATTLPDGPVLDFLRRYLTDGRKIPISKIVMLTETGTSYGSGLADKEIKQLPYPLSLSRIRSQYEVRDGESKRARQSYAERRKNLDLSLELPPYARDVLPTFSDATEAVADVALEQILSTIIRDDIRAVGLFGTDVRDKLFLAQQIRRHAPDVQLFTVGTDLLYSHAAYSRHFKGTIIASPYPLFSRSQAWTSDPIPKRAVLTFSNDIAQGIYNATVEVLNREFEDEEPLLDYRHPLLADSSRPPLWLTVVGDTSLWPVQVTDKVLAKSSRPSLWLTVVGHSSLWPVQITNKFANGEAHKRVEDYTLKRDTANEKPEFAVPPPSLIPLSISSLACVLAITAFFIANGRWTDWGARFFPWLALTPHVNRESASGRHRYTNRRCAVLVFFAGLALLQIAVASPASATLSLSLADGIELTEKCWGLIAVLTANAPFVLLVWFVWTAVRNRKAMPHNDESSSVTDDIGENEGRNGFIRDSKNVIVITLINAIALLALWFLPQATSNAELAIFMERVGTFSSGVTPLFPLILILTAICFWAICEMRRTHFLDIYELQSPFPEIGADAMIQSDNHVAGMEKRCCDLQRRLSAFFFWPTEPMDWLFLVLLFSGIGYAIVVRWIGTAEGLVFDIFFRVLTFVAFACFAGLFIRMKAVCGLFERLLRRMGQHAMVPAYQRVPQRLKAKVAGHIFAAAPHVGDLDAAVRCLNRLENRRRLDHGVSSIRTDFADLLQKERKDKTIAYMDAAALNRKFATYAAQKLMPELQCHWDKKEFTGDETKEQDSKRLTWEEEAEVFLAIHYVNLIRQVFAHIQNMMTFLVLMLLCLLFCFDSYPFQPHHLLVRLCFGLVIWTSAFMIIVIFKFNRNEVLSRLSDTRPNRFTLDRSLLFPLFAYVAVPLVSLMIIRFPTLDRMFFGWLNAWQ